MTEGIIQEVIKKWRQKFIDGNVSLDSLLIEVEKELIEKIKQKRVWQWDAVRLRDLIGDKQE